METWSPDLHDEYRLAQAQRECALELAEIADDPVMNVSVIRRTSIRSPDKRRFGGSTAPYGIYLLSGNPLVCTAGLEV